MLGDSRQLETDVRIDCDVCIVGAGAAGITLAMELTGTALRVCVVESGGFEFNQATQQLYASDNIGQPYPATEVSRLRQFGGTTNHWLGACAPLDALDFEARPWVPHSGWPFDRSVLDPFYERAQIYCELGPYQYSSSYWSETLNRPVLATDPSKIVTAMIQGSPPTRFAETYRATLGSARNVTVWLHGNVVELVTVAGGERLSMVRVSVMGGNEYTVRARCFVLATGGIENARLLLLSNRVHAAGLGNQFDLVGRFFMDHPVIEGAVLRPTRDFNRRLYAPTEMGKYAVAGFFQIGDDRLRQESLLNVKMPLVAVDNYYLSEGIESYHAIDRALREGTLPDDIVTHIGNIAGDIDMIIEAISRKVLGEGVFDAADEIGGYLLDTMIEQSPNPESRITLSRQRDALGLRRVQVDWRLQDGDRENLWRCYRVLASELGRLQVGRLQIRNPSNYEHLFDDLLSFGHHHMGTTRAHVDPKRGVVDANMKIHGMNNLFVAGSSVFPTGGHVPPTLTIVALAIRLAEHIKHVLGATK